MGDHVHLDASTTSAVVGETIWLKNARGESVSVPFATLSRIARELRLSQGA